MATIDMVLAKQSLGIIAATLGCQHAGGIYLHFSFGRIVDRLAARSARTLLCIPVEEGPPGESRDYRLRANVELVPQPFYPSSIGALRHAVAITRAYAHVCREADTLFIRGMVPYVAHLYALAYWHRRRPCHWVIGNPVMLLKSHQRAGWMRDTAALLYAWQDRLFTRQGRRLTAGSIICNGEELARVFASSRTMMTVSSSVTNDEFYERADTCQGATIRILFIGFIRPEKGIQYLIEAMARLNTGRTCTLTIAGTGGQFQTYRKELERMVVRLGLADRLRWAGYVPLGTRMIQLLREHDILVLPTLSEGTPHVLSEARANSLPIVASRVGGIPTMVTDGVDGLLVPPKEPKAIAAALTRIITEPELRRNLIGSGVRTTRRYTVDRFADMVERILQE